MSWWRVSDQSASANMLSDQEVNSRQKAGSDGKHHVTSSHGKRLTPLSRAIDHPETPLNKREVRSLQQAMTIYETENNPEPLQDWLKAYQVRKAVSRKNTPQGPRLKGTSLSSRNIQPATMESKMIRAVEQFITTLLPVQPPKEGGGATTKVPTHKRADKKRRRRKPNGASSVAMKGNKVPGISNKEKSEDVDSQYIPGIHKPPGEVDSSS